ncbi:UNVERIFIED_CONTAM: hypothetical protein GTU68_008971 [Idotea baltica]|nr:hypothetical protein [Idotea baltica]
MHFAAFISVGESCEKPFDYYHNNVGGMLNLLLAMREADVKRLVFSSTAAVYGDVAPEAMPISEDTPKSPINPYGESKLSCERLIESASIQWGLRATALRYFNASGASNDGGFAEAHKKEEHLIPRAILFALGITKKFAIYGEDFPTDDGTCIRDYVHVDDLAEAHSLALAKMESREGFHAYNVGSGTGYSVRQVISAVERSLGLELNVSATERRAGDPAILIADSSRLRKELAWAPRYDDIDTIVQSAVTWHQSAVYKRICPNACG